MADKQNNMGTTFVERIDTLQDLEEVDIFQMLFHEYERVAVTSLITSFGLEFILSEAHLATGEDAFLFDQNGGDVDTILGVRETGRFKKRLNSSRTPTHWRIPPTSPKLFLTPSTLEQYGGQFPCLFLECCVARSRGQ